CDERPAVYAHIQVPLERTSGERFCSGQSNPTGWGRQMGNGTNLGQGKDYPVFSSEFIHPHRRISE
ncbi:MAG: hypothetical protein ACKO23_02965, partial [Gemmataceae bacterium]